jgi:hypothetical protein
LTRRRNPPLARLLDRCFRSTPDWPYRHLAPRGAPIQPAGRQGTGPRSRPRHGYRDLVASTAVRVGERGRDEASPVDLRMPCGPVRVNSVWVLMDLNASSTASVGPFDRGRRGRALPVASKIHSDRIGGEEQGLRIHQLREDEDRVVLRADADKAHTSRRRLRRSGRLWRRGRSPSSHRLATVSLLGAPFANSSAPMRESTALRVGASRLELLTPCL